jgi:hypothetical protein
MGQRKREREMSKHDCATNACGPDGHNIDIEAYDLLKDQLTLAREVLKKWKCRYCEGTGRATWYRADKGPCGFCGETGLNPVAQQTLAKLSETK